MVESVIGYMWVQVPPGPPRQDTMSREEEVRAEIERLKNIPIQPGNYIHLTEPIKYSIISVDEENQTAIVRTEKSGFDRARTLHWCRKHLKRI